MVEEGVVGEGEVDEGLGWEEVHDVEDEFWGEAVEGVVGVVG